MAVSLRNKVAVVGASATVSITLPVGILGGECIRLTIGWNNGNTGVTCSAPAGFTFLDTASGLTASAASYYKIASGTIGAASPDAGAVVTATLSVSKAWVASCRVFIGADPVNPIHAHGMTSSTTVALTHAAPTLAITVGGCWIEEGVVERASSTGYTAPAAVSADQASAGPQAVSSPALIAVADTGAAVATGTRGGDVWTGTVSTSSVVVWATAVAPPHSTPTASFGGGATGGFTVNVDATASTAIAPATLTAYDWDWGDSSTHGTGVTARHNYAAAGPGTYLVTLTVTDSAAATASVTVPVTVGAPSATVSPLSVLAPGFTPTGGTELAVFTDTLESTYDTSPGGPSGILKTYFFAEIAAPIAGQGLYFETLTDRLASSSGSFTAKLYQDTAKTVLISTVTGVAIPDGTASGAHPDSAVTPPLIVNFPSSDVAAMTDFSTPTVELTETAA